MKTLCVFAAFLGLCSGARAQWDELAKLLAGDGAADDEFGYSVSISGDYAVIGAYYDDDNGVDAGAAYVFVRSGSTWSLHPKLTASDGAAGDDFGYSVALCGDYAVIGAPYHDDNAPDAGSAYVFGLHCPSLDSDGDGTPDCSDGCPDDPNKTAPGACGCGEPDDDTDGDGVPDCFDECPDDQSKIAAGACGCGEPDDDTDGDRVPDCFDECPDDPNKLEPGVCGCGHSD